MAVSLGSTTYDVYVANLPVEYSEQQIRQIFDVAGEIAGVKIIAPKPGITGKIAFVKFLKEADAQCVAQYMSNYQLEDGRTLNINYRPNQNQKSTSTSSNPLVNKAHSNTTGHVDPIVNGVDKKVDETLLLYVSDVSTPLEFSAHLYNKELASKLDKLTRSMEALCPSQPKVVGQLSMDDMTYGCKFSVDEMWYRCRVHKCLPKNEIEVRYIDYGNSEVINRFLLVQLPGELVNLPPLCDHYALDDLELVDRDITSELNMKGLDLFRTMIAETRVEVKWVRKEFSRTKVKLLKVLDSPFSENFREKMISTGAVKVKMAGKSPLLKINKSPTTLKSPATVRSPQAVITPISMKSPAKQPPAPTKEDIALPSYPPSEKSISSPSSVVPDKDEVLQPKKDAIQIYVSHIESPLEFWGQIYDAELEVKLLSLTAQLEDICPAQRKITSQDPHSAIYGCKFSQDGLWYRCKIEETINNTEVQVRYVDYGNSEITAKSGLVYLAPLISSMEVLCKQYMIGGLELVNKETTSETYRQGIHALQALIGEQKVHIHELKTEYGTHIVRIDKVADVPVDVTTELIGQGVVRLKNVECNTKVKPERVKRMIFTPDPSDVEDTQSPPMIFAPSPNLNVNEKPGDGHATYADKMLSKMATKVKCIKPVKPTELLANGGTSHSDLLGSLDKYMKEMDNKTEEVVDYRILPKKVEKSVPSTQDTTLSNGISTKAIASPTQDPAFFVVPPKSIETNTAHTVKRDAETNTVPVLPKDVVEMNTSSTSTVVNSFRDSNDNISSVKSYEEYTKLIEEKRKEVEDLKEKLQEKTKLVDECFKKIPTPGCKRDLYQLYDDDIYENEEDVSKSNAQATKEEKPSLHDIGGYKKEIAELRELLEAPLLHEKLFEDVGVKPAHGILVSGERGCGKSLIARAVASDINTFFVELNGASLMGRPINELQKVLADAFKEAENNPPAIIFIDELDKIAPKMATDKSKIVVSQILRLWNTLKKKAHCILLATVNGDNIDPSLKGYGLFERDIKISVPNTQQRLGILSMLTKKMNLHADVSLKNIAEQTGGYVAADLATLCNVAGMQVIRRKLSTMHIKKEEGFLLDKSCTSTSCTLQSTTLTACMLDFKHALLLTKPSATKIYEIPEVTWDHVGGLADVKSDLQNFIKYSTEYSSKFKQYGISPPRGVLLHGPKGCGKRTLAKAFANQCKYNFVNVDGCELIDVLTNDAKRNEFAAKIENDMPCVVFINIDFITDGRAYKFEEFFSTMDNLLVKNDMFVIGSATSLDNVHPSFKIEGRLDHVIHVPLPDENSRAAILQMKLNTISKSEEVNFTEIAKSTQGLCGREIIEICDKVCKCAIIDSINSHKYNKEKDDKGKMCGTPRLTLYHFSKILEPAEEKTTASEDISCVQKDVLANDMMLNSQTDTSLYLTRVIEKMLAEQSIKDAMREMATEKDTVFEGSQCEDGNERTSDESQIRLTSQRDTSLYLNQLMENRVRETIIKDAMQETTTTTTTREMNIEEETEIAVKENITEATKDIEEFGIYNESKEPVCKMTQHEETTDTEATTRNNEELVNEVNEVEETVSHESVGSFSELKQYEDESSSFVEVAIENGCEEPVHEVEQPEELNDIVVANYIEVQTHNENEQPVVCELKEPEVVEIPSDSEDKDILNESFESCDSNLDGGTLDVEEIVELSHDVAETSLVSHDEPSYIDGQELEGWNAALLNKKTIEPRDIPIVEYEDGKGDEFF